MTPTEVLALCREKDVKAVDLRFMDFPGLWQHFTIPVGSLDEDVFEDGLGFDGSSIRAWQAINESDMLEVPQPETASLDPITTLTTLGYGDIVPNTRFAAILTNSEAIIGQLFLTIFVARLVGLYIVSEQADSRAKPPSHD